MLRWDIWRDGALALLVLAGLLVAPGCGRVGTVDGEPSSAPQRIVSLTPSITEILFALEAGDRVVGVSDDSTYPPETAQKAKVGGFLTGNVEAIVALDPDLVLGPPEQDELAGQLRQLGISVRLIKQYSVPEIIQSIKDVADLLAVSSRGHAVIETIQAQLEAVRARTEGRPRPKVLVSVGRDYASSRLDRVYVASSGSFFAGLVELAGGKNAYNSAGFAYPMISGEGMFQLQPEVIFEIAPDRAKLGVAVETIRQAWDAFPELPAVRDGRVYVLDEPYIGIPGPRVGQAVEAMARCLHPEAFP